MSALREVEVGTDKVVGRISAHQLQLPLTSWDEGLTLRTASGQRLKRWGSVAEMRKMLYDLDRHACYMLIKDGEVEGFKQGSRDGKAKNCSYKVDLLSVWSYRVKHYGR
ncbi:MAG: hypothetical protein ACSHX0_11995 [Akkermansiaceae bacterium]